MICIVPLSFYSVSFKDLEGGGGNTSVRCVCCVHVHTTIHAHTEGAEYVRCLLWLILMRQDLSVNLGLTILTRLGTGSEDLPVSTPSAGVTGMWGYAWVFLFVYLFFNVDSWDLNSSLHTYKYSYSLTHLPRPSFSHEKQQPQKYLIEKKKNLQC